MEFIDFDSIRDVNNGGNTAFSYTREWAAPEQLNPYAVGKIGNTADIYTVGADIFRSMHDRHIIRGMYFDMLGCYYDTLLNGAYYPENDEEAELLEQLFDNMGYAISEMQLSSDRRREKYLPQYCLSMASVLLRSVPDAESYAEASELLDMAKEFITENSAEHCYYCMTLEWYYTLAEPDFEETRALTEQAE
ncbi:MAG: hypothetical protein K6C68_13710 [Ruminococcus sp.]|nr:hypothetical protein [Ruminococcus sp.]